MRLIKHLKSLGLDLKRIKEILGDIPNHKTLREVLQSLRIELLNEKKSLEERVARIELLLSDDTVLLDEDIGNSPSFQIITEKLTPEQIENYAQACPDFSISNEIIASWIIFIGAKVTKILFRH